MLKLEEDKMSCHGICISASGSGPGGSYAMQMRSYGQRPGAEYGGPSYFKDPNALTALEFEQSRDARYARNPDGDVGLHEDGFAAALGYDQKQGYAAKQSGRVYAESQKLAPRDEERARLGANIAYHESLKNASLGGKALDYSLMASAKLAWEQMRELMEGNLQVIATDQVRGLDEGLDHLQVYTNISGVQPVQSGLERTGLDDVLVYQPRAEVSQRSASVARRRSLLETLILKDKEGAALMN